MMRTWQPSTSMSEAAQIRRCRKAWYSTRPSEREPVLATAPHARSKKGAGLGNFFFVACPVLGGYRGLAGAAARALDRDHPAALEQLTAPDAAGLAPLQRTGQAGGADRAPRAQLL